jgi:hypothetical protein
MGRPVSLHRLVPPPVSACGGGSCPGWCQVQLLKLASSGSLLYDVKPMSRSRGGELALA